MAASEADPVLLAGDLPAERHRLPARVTRYWRWRAFSLFPLVRTDRAESLIRRALPELPWPSQPLLVLPARVHRRYLTVPLWYAAGFTLLLLFLPDWWELVAILPVPLGFVLGAARAREVRWRVDDQSVMLRWRRVLNRNTVIAHRGGSQLTELPSSPWKARAGVAGFKMRFSSGRGAGIRYMVDSDALLLLHTVGRAWHVGTERRGSTNQPSEATTSW